MPWNNFQFFNDFFGSVIIQVYQPNRKSPLGFDNKLLQKFYLLWKSFQIFNVTNHRFFFIKLAFISFENLCRNLGLSSLKSRGTSSTV